VENLGPTIPQSPDQSSQFGPIDGIHREEMAGHSGRSKKLDSGERGELGEFK